MIIWKIILLYWCLAIESSSPVKRTEMQEPFKRDDSVAFLEFDLAFQKACKMRNFRIVKAFLNHPCVNPFANYKTGLKYAISQGDIALTNVLLESEKIINSGKTIKILFEAVSGKNKIFEIVDRFVVKLGPQFDINLFNTLIDLACNTENVEAMMVLLKHGATFEIDKPALFLKAHQPRMAVFLLHEFNLSPISNWPKQSLKKHPFITICESNDLEAVKLAAQNVSIVDIKKALDTACVLSNLDMLQFLLGHPSAVNLPDISKFTFNWLWSPLHLLSSASEEQSTAMVQFLLERFDNWRDMQVSLALCSACRRGYLKTVLLFLQYSPNLSPSEYVRHTNLPLHAACISRNVALVDVLLAQPTLNTVRNEEIHAAIEANSVEILQLLLTKSAAQGSIQQLNLNTALIRACERTDNCQIVDMLLQQLGVDPAFNENKPFIEACMNGRSFIVQRLLELCPKANSVTRNNQAIIFASRYGHLETVKLLVKHGADPATNRNRPLLLACSWNKLDVVKFLLTLPSVTPNVNILSDASSKSLQILLADARISPILANISVKLLDTMCNKKLKRMILFLAHPQVKYKLAYETSINDPYIRGFLQNFPVTSFEAFENADFEAAKSIDFTQVSWLLLDVLIRRYKDKPALWEILLDGRIKQLAFDPILESDLYLRNFIYERLYLDLFELIEALHCYFNLKAVFRSRLLDITFDTIHHLGHFAQFPVNIVRYVIWEWNDRMAKNCESAFKPSNNEI